MENRTFDYAGLCEELREALRTVKADVTVGYNPNPGVINVYRKDVPNEPCTPSVCTLLVRKFNRSSQSTDQQREIDQLKGENIMQKRANADLEDNINFLKDAIENLKNENGGLECRIIDIKGENNLLKSEISKRDKMIKSLTDYIEALQKSRTPVVFTATKDELKEVQEFIAKHVL